MTRNKTAYYLDVIMTLEKLVRLLNEEAQPPSIIFALEGKIRAYDAKMRSELKNVQKKMG